MRIEPGTSPMRSLEALVDRFGIFEAVASSTIQLARLDAESDLAMDVQVAEAVLEFGDDIRAALQVTNEWARAKRLISRSSGEGERPLWVVVVTGAHRNSAPIRCR